MRPFADTITLDEARRLIREAIAPLVRHETIALDMADGRVLAEDVVAPMDQPPFDRSAMDGYAVRAADVAGATRGVPKVLRLIGRAYTAEPFAGTLAPGDCVEIATGAPIPDGADAVVMVEDTGRPGTRRLAGAGVARLGRAGAGAGRGAAADSTSSAAARTCARTTSSLRAGQAITPSRIGALAAIGRDQVRVIGKPIVAIFPTGNEVVRQGQPLPLASVYDVNSFTVAALVARHGGVAERHAPVPDTIEAVGDGARRGGGRRHRRARRRQLGRRARRGDRRGGGARRGDLPRHRRQAGQADAVRADRPPCPSRRHQLVFGMPGNPTSCLSQAHVLLVPALRQLAGLPPIDPPRVRRRLASAVGSPANRHQFLPVRIEGDLAVPTFKGSGEITSLSQADGYVEIPVGVARLDAGTDVEVVGYE